VAPRAGLDMMAKRKIPSQLGIEPQPSILLLISTELHSLPEQGRVTVSLNLAGYDPYVYLDTSLHTRKGGIM
jgi:hypothetical protein